MIDFPENAVLDTEKVPQALLDIKSRTRTSLFPWRGQFSPQLVETLLKAFATQSAVVLDPFVGSGTTLFEAARLGYPCRGSEINPAAIAMAETALFASVELSNRREICLKAWKEIQNNVPMLGGGGEFSGKVKLILTSLVREHTRNSFLKNVFQNVLIRFSGCPSPTSRNLNQAFLEHQSIILNLPKAAAFIEVEMADARKLPWPSNSVDLVLTSPPYINVFNYHQNNREAMELLGWDLLSIAKSEFGANRKHRANRFLTVTQYCLDITQVFQELKRVAKSAARLILVLGRESAVRGVSFKNGSLVAALAKVCGFTLLLRQERKFLNMFGETIYEDILHFAHSEQPQLDEPLNPLTGARQLAARALQESLDTAQTAEIRRDLLDAVSEVEKVMPSPTLQPRNSFPDA